MIVTAHRGFSGLYPENTMLAFAKAEEAGADEIELDVQLSRDGQVVVFHDDSLERLTGQRGSVRDFIYDELEKMNVAKGVYGDKFGFNPIPTLNQYFAWVKNTGIKTNIEIKNGRYYFEELEEKTLALIAEHNVQEKVYFSSFTHVSLLKCKKINPSIPCGALVVMAAGNTGYYLRSNGLDFCHPEIKSLNDEIVADCEKYGVGINVWTVNDMAGLQKAHAWKCRGVITDFPDVCKAWISKN